ncbi:MAG: hypothetical protein KF868_17250 [Acidobacteria bacterium]|nr:hypothetical protein [Acidobacteriota bacterium]MCW5968975.1 hypothetical protein [Blastocatellales bacterium]
MECRCLGGSGLAMQIGATLGQAGEGGGTTLTRFRGEEPGAVDILDEA